MKWSQPSKRRPGGGIHNHPDPEVWETNDFCVRQMGVSSYSSLMRLQLGGSRGINSSRRRKKSSWRRSPAGPLAKGNAGSQAGRFQVMTGWARGNWHVKQAQDTVVTDPGQARLMTDRHQLRGPICLSRHSRGETGGVWTLKREQ